MLPYLIAGAIGYGIAKLFEEDKAPKFNDGGSVLLAPNGKRSYLTPEQYELVRTPEFKAWFGDWQNSPETASKVVDENGEPMVVYHATNNQFNVFKAKYNNDGISLIYFTDKKIVAEKYGNVIKNFFLKIENLSEIDVEYKGFNDAYDNTSLEGELRYTEEGLLIKNIYDDPSGKKKGRISNVYAVKYPEQIKLADGTNTTFDGNNPDIRFELGGIFHGSPYHFDRFSTSKMGSGIGQQESGWGLYLTDDKEASKNYGKYIYETTLFKDKKPNEYNFLELKKPVPKNLVRKIIEAIYKKEKKDFDLVSFNLFYKQSKNNSLEKINFNDFELITFDYGGYLFYKTLSRILGGDKFASLFLLENGIDGLKSSFVNNKGVHYRTDYVIFDEKAITIENREYLPNNYYADGGSVLLAPNGKPSNLTPKQYKLVRTPAFKQWFGDWENSPETSSKVVDENGEPLVVYHGTNAEFNKFKPSVKALASHTKRTQPIFFSPNLQFASAYGRNVKSIFLNIRKLFYGRKLNQEQEDYFYDLIYNDEIKKGTNENSAIEHAYQTLRNLKLGSWGVLESDFMWNFYKQYDYNGFIVDEGYKNYAVFNSNQIKLADGSNTTFDGNNPDIRFDGGGIIISNEYSTDSYDFGNVGNAIIQNGIEVGQIQYDINTNNSISIYLLETLQKGIGAKVINYFFADGVNIIYGDAVDSFDFWKKMGAKFDEFNEDINGYPFTISKEDFMQTKYFKNPDIRFDGGGELKYKNKGAYSNVTQVNNKEWYLNMIEAEIEGKGYAKKIMNQIIQDAKNKKVEKIILDASLMNKDYFEYGYGFEEVSYNDDDGLYRMELNLN
jgi:hypothetical protein